MSMNVKRAIVSLFGGLGLIFLLIGAIGHVYPTSTGVIIMICCWVVSGFLAKLWGIQKNKSDKA
jgi:hypothetical protein